MKKTIVAVMLILITGLSLAQGPVSITDSYNAETAKNYTRALQIMEDLSAKEPNDDFYALRIAWLQYLLGRYNDAIKNYQKSNNISHSLDAQTGILNCQLALGKWDEARALADQILKSYPQNTVIMGKAAYAAYMKQQYRDVADYYLAILKVTPWDMEARAYLVNNLYQAKDIEAAKKQYQLLKKYYPESAMVKEYAKVLNQ
jgi:tetratricopeptide (TPR) repeat protein